MNTHTKAYDKLLKDIDGTRKELLKRLDNND
jgi:hypothetical protein